jgi:hypothetical protein
VGLAPRRESAREATRRRKPDRGGQAVRPVAGLSILPTRRIGESPGDRGTFERHSSTEGASDRRSVAL